MGFGILPYTLATGGSVTDADMAAVTDPDFSARNNHFIFSEQYKLLGVFAQSANGVRYNIQIPSFEAFSRFNIYPHNKSATIPSPPQVMWLRHMPPLIPQNEELTVKVTDGTSEVATVFLWLGTNDWNANLPAYKTLIPTRFTATVTIVANGWSTLSALTFEKTLRGGTWAVVGAQLQGTNVQAFRIVFPKYRLAYGVRRMRPGFLAQNALGDLEEAAVLANPFMLGEWGRFFTFEPPQLEIYGTTAASTALEGRLWLAYLGESDQTAY